MSEVSIGRFFVGSVVIILSILVGLGQITVPAWLLIALVAVGLWL